MDWFHQFRTNENQALKDVYRLYRKECILFTRRKFGLSQEDAIDVFQNSVLILYHNTATGKLTQLSPDLKSYLYGIIRLKALEHVRLKSRTIYPEDLQSTLASLPDSPIDEEPRLVTLLKTLLPKLGTACRLLLEMFYYREMTISEIAKGSDYSGADSVKTQKYKCMKKLQTMILEHISIKGREI